MLEKFKSTISNGYSFKGDSIILGAALIDKNPIKGVQVSIPLSTTNRHGLICGATGTGKTKSLQYFSEQLSAKGVSVLLMDVKGDLSGIAKEGEINDIIKLRSDFAGVDWAAKAYPVELLSISKEKGVRLRATVSEFGPVLFSKMLELNDNQAGVVSLIFKYCDNKGIPLLDIKDFRAILTYLVGEGKTEISQYGSISTSSSGVILRKLIELEEQGADVFFGEPSFEVEDLVRTDISGRGFINILRICDIQSKPKLFSTFMLCLMTEIYYKFPEQGDKTKPKLAIFIDEAHLVFKEASRALLDNLETVIKLIRSKGVGIYFCTQSPNDIPAPILGQLGLKIQHALRAFTANDRKAIDLVAKNYPISDFYKTEDLITELGIGEAFVTCLNEKGVPTPLVHCLICAPAARMDILNTAEQDEVMNNSLLNTKYNNDFDRESAYEILNKKLESSRHVKNVGSNEEKEDGGSGSTVKHIINSSIARTILREVTRGILGVLIGAPKKRTPRRKTLF